MDHDYINEHGVVSLYVAGKLSPEERAGFEEHFVDCQQCLEQIEVTAELREGLRQVAKEDAGRPGVARADIAGLGVAPQLAPAFWVGAGSWNQRGLLAYAMVAVVGLAAIFFVDARYRRSEVAEARRASDDWQRRYAEERQARENLQRQQVQSAGNAADNAGKQNGDQGPMVASLQPAPLFFLNVTRGTDEGSAPANRVAVSPAAPLIALSLEFEKDPAFRSYRARLSDGQGRVLWSAENIPSPASDAIAITLPSRLLSSGNYSVALDGLTAGGRYLPTAHFTFQASPQK
jgi:predicted HAD superfamily Cof-like phosphohydrolase